MNGIWLVTRDTNSTSIDRLEGFLSLQTKKWTGTPLRTETAGSRDCDTRQGRRPGIERGDDLCPGRDGDPDTLQSIVDFIPSTPDPFERRGEDRLPEQGLPMRRVVRHLQVVV